MGLAELLQPQSLAGGVSLPQTLTPPLFFRDVVPALVIALFSELRLPGVV
jgi:hypothetical protein